MKNLMFDELRKKSFRIGKVGEERLGEEDGRGVEK